MTETTSESKARKEFIQEALLASDHTYQDLADAAHVSYRMVQFWIDGDKTSPNIAAHFTRLTGRQAP